MTDQEIIKALRCCANNMAICYKCPFQTEMSCRAMLITLQLLPKLRSKDGRRC